MYMYHKVFINIPCGTLYLYNYINFINTENDVSSCQVNNAVNIVNIYQHHYCINISKIWD